MAKATSSANNSLGKAQADLEAATTELRNAQSALEKAQVRYSVAAETHETAIVALVSEANTVRVNAKVVPLSLK